MGERTGQFLMHALSTVKKGSIKHLRRPNPQILDPPERISHPLPLPLALGPHHLRSSRFARQNPMNILLWDEAERSRRGADDGVVSVAKEEAVRDGE